MLDCSWKERVGEFVHKFSQLIILPTLIEGFFYFLPLLSETIIFDTC